MLHTKLIAISLLLSIFFMTGCGSSPAQQVRQKTASPPTGTAATSSGSPAESQAIAQGLQASVHAFLANDFSEAHKLFFIQPGKANDPKTRKMFADFSSHINNRFALQAKDSAVKSPSPVVSIDELRLDESSRAILNISLRAAAEIPPLNLEVKMVRSKDSWLLDLDFFVLALIDALDE